MNDLMKAEMEIYSACIKETHFQIQMSGILSAQSFHCLSDLFLIYLIYLVVAIISSTRTALDARGLMCPWQAQSNFWSGPCHVINWAFLFYIGF